MDVSVAAKPSRFKISFTNCAPYLCLTAPCIKGSGLVANMDQVQIVGLSDLLIMINSRSSID